MAKNPSVVMRVIAPFQLILGECLIPGYIIRKRTCFWAVSLKIAWNPFVWWIQNFNQITISPPQDPRAIHLLKKQ